MTFDIYFDSAPFLHQAKDYSSRLEGYLEDAAESKAELRQKFIDDLTHAENVKKQAIEKERAKKENAQEEEKQMRREVVTWRCWWTAVKKRAKTSGLNQSTLNWVFRARPNLRGPPRGQ